MRANHSAARLALAVCGAALLAGGAGVLTAQQPPAAPPGTPPAQAPGGRGGGGRGGPSPLAAPLFTAFDANKDGSVTRAELKAAFGAWYAAADSGNAGSATQAQLTTALGAVFPPPPPADPAAPGAGGGGGGRGGRGFGPFVAGATTPGLNEKCGGRSQTPTQACPEDIEKMMAALPAAAPAKPARPHKVLAWSRIPSAGFQHSSIPLAVKAIEELGKKTGAWTTDVSWDPAVFTAANLKQYDAIFLSSTTGCFLDMAPEADTPEARAISKKTTEERRAAFLEFVRSGKGVAGIHATGDSYHSACPNDEPTAGGGRGGFGRGGGAGSSGQVSSIILRWSWGLNEAKLQKNELTLTRADMEAVSDGWYNELDPEKSGKVSQADFTTRFAPIATQIGAAGRDNGRGSWLDWDNMIGGWFKFHWNDPQKITVKIDDKKSPLTKMFAGGADFDVNDETYTFSVNSFSRENVHVLTSINYDKMSFIDKLKESNPRPDHDFGLSWIRKDGQGRLFYMALGHNERIYAMKPMMEHLLAGMQYALGDLKADDSPSVKGSAKKTASK